VITFAGYQVISGNLTMGTMVAFVGYMERDYSPLRRLINSSTTLTQSIASIDRVFELMNEKYDILDKENATELGLVDGSITVENVSFQYDEVIMHVLSYGNLSVEKGDTIALVGMSGGRKSTVISLIPRFYDVTSGSIKVDRMYIRDVKARSLRNNICMV